MTTFLARRRRFPERTYKGRERVSLVPRWVGNWVMFFSVTYFGGSYLFAMLGVADAVYDPFASNDATITPLPTFYVPPVTPTAMSFSASSKNVTPDLDGVFLPSSSGEHGQVISTPVPVQPTYTPLPTQTPYPTQVPIHGDLVAVGYSFYWPPYGPPNCHLDNWDEVGNYCKDVTASGERWSDYIGKGVAVPWEWVQSGFMPLGTVLRVHDNIDMQGLYKVVDICGACIKPEGHIYIDFLDNRQRLAWTVPLMIEVVSRPDSP
jgi:hypothetical protein